MTGVAPEKRAVQLLREFEARFDVDEVPPVPVERIASSFLDLLIREVGDVRSVPNAPSDQGRLSGFVDPPTKTIWIDAAEARKSPGRRRFTIAHECGHWVLHVANDQSGYFCRPCDIAESAASAEAESNVVPLAKREAEANAFASELLMPETLITEQANETGCNLSALSDRFQVSVPAMRVRLTTLGLMPTWMAKTPPPKRSRR